MLIIEPRANKLQWSMYVQICTNTERKQTRSRLEVYNSPRSYKGKIIRISFLPLDAEDTHSSL